MNFYFTIRLEPPVPFWKSKAFGCLLKFSRNAVTWDPEITCVLYFPCGNPFSCRFSFFPQPLPSSTLAMRLGEVKYGEPLKGHGWKLYRGAKPLLRTMLPFLWRGIECCSPKVFISCLLSHVPYGMIVWWLCVALFMFTHCMLSLKSYWTKSYTYVFITYICALLKAQ